MIRTYLTSCSGTALIEGTVDEPSTVEVNDQPADVTSLPGGDFLFRREIPVDEGNNTVTIEATQSYNIVVGGIEKTLEYDLNGNLRFEKDDQDNVLREFQWDAKNRLIKIIDGTQTSEFEYDGLDRRIRIVEKDNGTETSHETYLWVGTQIAQKRDSTATTVQRNYFSDGFTEGANSYFYTKDHLGSIREVIASDGTTVESRYDYTPWGQVTKTAGTGVESDFLYTGHLYHEPSDLHLTLYRAYDPSTGRWLSPDPIGEAGGLNLYGYVGNDPINDWDPLGLWMFSGTAGKGLGLSFHFGHNGGQFQWGVAFGFAAGASLDASFTDSGCRSTSPEIYLQGKASVGNPALGAGGDATLAFELNRTGNARFDVNGSGNVGLTSYGGSATHIKGHGWLPLSPSVGKLIPLSAKDVHPHAGASGFLGVGLRGAVGSGCSKSSPLP